MQGCGCALRPVWCGWVWSHWTHQAPRDATSLKNYDAVRAENAIGRLEERIAELLAAAAEADAVEDAAEVEQPAVSAELADRRRRLAKLQEAKARLDEQAVQAQQVEDQRRADWRGSSGQWSRVGVKPASKPPERTSTGLRTNLADPDSRILRVAGGYVQGCNAQAVVTSDQLRGAAEPWLITAPGPS